MIDRTLSVWARCSQRFHRRGWDPEEILTWLHTVVDLGHDAFIAAASSIGRSSPTTWFWWSSSLGMLVGGPFIPVINGSIVHRRWRSRNSVPWSINNLGLFLNRRLGIDSVVGSFLDISSSWLQRSRPPHFYGTLHVAEVVRLGGFTWWMRLFLSSRRGRMMSIFR